ncbi:MAG TPA: hypothetical protein VFG59_03400 [Anaeromyxobacter sp.]|nr:hypothetical protein [Anaeromyxobacter sp.]
MTGRRSRSGRPPKVASKGVKVTAVKATHGPPATSVHVEVEPDDLKEDLGELGEVRSVTARIPEAGEAGRIRWREVRLDRLGAGPEARGSRRTVARYFKVHYGPTEQRAGVGVKVDTDRGLVEAQPRDQAYTVKEESKPGESSLERRRRKH